MKYVLFSKSTKKIVAFKLLSLAFAWCLETGSLGTSSVAEDDLEPVSWSACLHTSSNCFIVVWFCFGVFLANRDVFGTRVERSRREEQLQLSHQTLSQPRTSAKPQNTLHH